jgi:four helix bundle protein
MQFLHISQGSLSELDTLMEVAHGLRYFTQEAWNTIDAPMIQIDKMITGLIRKLQHKNNKVSGVRDNKEGIRG